MNCPLKGTLGVFFLAFLFCHSTLDAESTRFLKFVRNDHYLSYEELGDEKSKFSALDSCFRRNDILGLNPYHGIFNDGKYFIVLGGLQGMGSGKGAKGRQYHLLFGFKKTGKP